MKRIGVYIHIPFCVKKCAYCDFLSAPPCDKGQMESYAEALCRELKLKAIDTAKTVDTVFFGGGTPSLLPIKAFERIMLTIRECYRISEDAEITVECNPETVDFDKLECYKRLGVNRISFGLQSASDKELKRIGRIHTFDKFLESYRLARRVGFDNINIDLISALPGQSVADWEYTLETVAKLSPEHISAYSLILEEGTKLYEDKDKFTFPTEDEDVEMYEATARILEDYGYKRYEISNYAKEGFESRHNNRYWKRSEYLGFGIGAASFVGDKRLSNICDINEYISSLYEGVSCDAEIKQAIEAKLIAEKEVLSKEDAMAEFFYLGLRRMEGVYFRDFWEMFEADAIEVYGEVMEKLVRQRLLEYTERGGEQIGVRLTTNGIFVSNSVFVEFL